MEPLGYLFYFLIFFPLWVILLVFSLVYKIYHIQQQIKKHKKAAVFWWDWLMISYLLLMLACVILYLNRCDKLISIIVIPIFTFSLFLLISRFFYPQKSSWADWLLVFPTLLASTLVFLHLIIIFYY
ncbi:hypothetical protein GvMRE_I2g127 [endosymbiont GvMRE of Glomus versiforme]|nr:hypothetical protein GvMRE_I2g127 [endosymbiont GvMRE of Glomus versiforme]